MTKIQKTNKYLCYLNIGELEFIWDLEFGDWNFNHLSSKFL
jgi:hypothetical protein